MSEPKTRPTTVPVADFIAAQPEERRRSECQTLVDLMTEASGVAPVMWGPSIVGFGAYLYTGAGGKPIEWPIIGFAPRKSDLTLYVLTGFEGQNELLARLGKHKTGRICLYLKKLADVDMDVLRAVIKGCVASMADRRVA